MLRQPFLFKLFARLRRWSSRVCGAHGSGSHGASRRTRSSGSSIFSRVVKWILGLEASSNFEPNAATVDVPQLCVGPHSAWPSTSIFSYRCYMSSPNYALHALPYLRHQYRLLSPLQALHACLALPLANFFKKKQNKNRKASTTSNVYHATYNFSPLLPTLSTTRPPLPILSTPTDTKPACGNIQTRILFCAPG